MGKLFAKLTAANGIIKMIFAVLVGVGFFGWLGIDVTNADSAVLIDTLFYGKILAGALLVYEGITGVIDFVKSRKAPEDHATNGPGKQVAGQKSRTLAISPLVFIFLFWQSPYLTYFIYFMVFVGLCYCFSYLRFKRLFRHKV